MAAAAECYYRLKPLDGAVRPRCKHCKRRDLIFLAQRCQGQDSERDIGINVGVVFDLLFVCLISAVLWTGEVWEFLSFTERHPSILYNILLFGLTSALGQVSDRGLCFS